MISVDELRKALKDCEEIKIPDDEIDRIIKEIDYLGNQKINYTEFIAATLDVKTFFTNEKLLAVF